MRDKGWGRPFFYFPCFRFDFCLNYTTIKGDMDGWMGWDGWQWMGKFGDGRGGRRGMEMEMEMEGSRTGAGSSTELSIKGVWL